MNGEQEICVEQEPIVIGGGGGAVNSVNGKTGDVVLTATDVEAVPTSAVKQTTGTSTSDVMSQKATTDALNTKQDKLTAGANITISPDNEISAAGVTVDSAMSDSSENPVQNKVITSALAAKADSSSLATVATTGAYSDLSGTPTIPTKTSDLTNDGSDNTSTYVEADELATVATTGNYSDLTGTPTIPTVGDATLTVTQNGTSVGTFTANALSDVTIAVTDTTYNAFTGTDGTAAGTAGLVPAPATTDAGKFLKADGTWDTAGGGTLYSGLGSNTDGAMTQKAVTDTLFADGASAQQVQIGTSSQSNGGHSIAIGDSAIAAGSSSRLGNIAIGWQANAKLSNAGQYAVAIGYKAETSNGGSVAIGKQAESGGDSIAIGSLAKTHTGTPGMTLLGAQSSALAMLGSYSTALGYDAKTMNNNIAYSYSVSLGSYSKPSRNSEVSVGDGSNNANYGTRYVANVRDGALANDAVNKGQLDGRVMTNAGAPTAATVGTVGQLLEDTTNGKLYQCTAISSGNYIWKEVSSSAGGYSILTSADYDPVENAILPWTLEPGVYRIDAGAASSLSFQPYSGAGSDIPHGGSIFVMNVGTSNPANYKLVIACEMYSSTPFFVELLDSSGSVTNWGGMEMGTFLTSGNLVDDLVTQDTQKALTANQGYELAQMISALDSRITALGG